MYAVYAVMFRGLDVSQNCIKLQCDFKQSLVPCGLCDWIAKTAHALIAGIWDCKNKLFEKLTMCESEKLADWIELIVANRTKKTINIRPIRANRTNIDLYINNIRPIRWANHKLAEQIERITNWIDLVIRPIREAEY